MVITCCKACPEAFEIPENCHCDTESNELFCLVEDCGDIADELFVIVGKLTIFGPLCPRDRQALRGLYMGMLTLHDSPCYNLVNCER